MAATNVLNDRRMVNALVFIDGNEVNYASLELYQTIGHHHRFRVELDYDAVKNGFLTNPKEQIALIGKTLEIELQQGDDNANSYEFRGIINNTINKASEGSYGRLIVEGKSNSILLERGKRFDVFSNMTLEKVFKEVLFGVDERRLSPRIKPVYKSQVPFLMQYNESDWEFLQRLSVLSGETLYWTGTDLIFGEHNEFPTLEVMYDKEITTLSFGSRLLSNNFTVYQYLSEKDEVISQTPAKIENANSYLNDVLARSSETLGTERPVRTPIDLPVEDLGALKEQANQRKVRTAAETVYVTGIAKTCHPRIGRLLNIKVPENGSGSAEIGTYRIVKVTHRIDQNHRYECEFEGIPSILKYRPVPEGIKMPVATSLLAKVTKNNDPKGQGRVQVEFQPVNDSRSELWLRVLMPDAGGSADGKVAQNRGFVFVPEVGDQVMVGFEYGDPNRPYVLGSMLHGKNAGGGGEGNKTKSLTTRSGSTVSLNDEDGSILVQDPSESKVELDGDENITISSNTSITLSCGKSTISMDKDGNISISGVKVGISGTEVVNVVSGEAGEEDSPPPPASGMVLTPKTVDIVATETTVVGAGTEVTVGSATVIVDGAKVIIQGGEEGIDISGTLVKINS